jgi:NAD(P)-dependent dehydrogenase (short-subunit alcohol dehydrogenase family)
MKLPVRSGHSSLSWWTAELRDTVAELEPVMYNTMENNIEGKVVVTMGASSGIGETTALLLVERGAKVVLGARIGSPQVSRWPYHGSGWRGSLCTHRRKTAWRPIRARKLACERYGKLDVLFSNAGVMPISPLDDLRVEDWEEMIDINIKGVLYDIAAALPVFPQAGVRTFH